MGWLYSVDSSIKSILKQFKDSILEKEEEADVIFWFKELDRSIVRKFYNNRDKIIGKKHKNKLILVLDSPGGEIDGAYLLIEVIKGYYKTLVIIVPCWAKSAATLVCLAADKLYLTPISELGPLDPQVREPGDVHAKSVLDEYKAIIRVRIEALEILDHAVKLLLVRSGGMSIPELLNPASNLVSGLIQPLYNQIDPAIIGKRARQLDIGAQYAERVLINHCTYLHDKKEIDKLVSKLVYEYPSHSFVINHSEAKALGLPVELLDSKKEFDDLVNLLCEKEVHVIGSFDEEDSRSKETQKKESIEKGEDSSDVM